MSHVVVGDAPVCLGAKQRVHKMAITKSEFRSIVIFGGAGFIGSNWTERLLETTDAKVHVYDNLSRQGARHNLEYLQKVAGRNGRLQITVGDVRDAAMVSKVVKYATEIYNFAAQVAVTTSLVEPKLDFDVNLGGTFNILEAARQHGTDPYFLFTSTNKVYGSVSDARAHAVGKRYVSFSDKGTDESQPLDFHSPYGCSKGGADQYVRDYARIYGLSSVVFRMSCIAGPRQFGSEDQGWVAHFLYSAIQGKPLTIYGDGRQVRDVLYVEDLLCAFEAAYANRENTAGQIYNLGGGQENTISLLELMDRVEELTGSRAGYNFGEQRAGDQLIYVTDYGKFSRHTGWKPKVNLDGILKGIYKWYKSNRELFAPTRAERLSAEFLAPVRRTA
jgi:CDP-paratose 2-epimerase